MNKDKKYLIIIYIPLIVIFVFCYVFYTYILKDIVLGNADLTRLSYVRISKNSFVPTSDLVTFSGENVKSTDILTFGDCFFRLNFQKYLSEYTNMKVTNVTNLKWSKYPINTHNNPLNALLIMINSGFLDEIHPKIIILETIQHNAIYRFVNSVDFNITDSQSNVLQFYRDTAEPQNILPEYNYINIGILKYFNNKLKLLLNIKQNKKQFYITDQVAVAELDRKMFSSEYPNYLFYHVPDYREMSNETTKNIQEMNDTLNKLNSILEKKNIKLFVMIIPNKYTYYQKYFIDSSMPKSNFYEIYKQQRKDYLTIEEFPTLSVLDAYAPDDTRWNFSYQKEIAKIVANKLKRSVK